MKRYEFTDMPRLKETLYWHRLALEREKQKEIETDRYKKPSVSDTSKLQVLPTVEV